MAALIGGGLALAGGVLKGIGSKSAGNQAASAAREAAQIQAQQFAQTRADLMPYNTAGQAVLPAVNALAMSGPTAGGTDYVKTAYDQFLPGTMTQAQLEATPGYQFTRDQGLKAVQSQAAARGLGVSGASMKGAAAFATGLANQTYKDQFNIQQQRFADVSGLSPLQQAQINNQWGRLIDTAKLGENAAAKTGDIGQTSAAAQGNALINAGNAQAQGQKGLTDAFGNALSDVGGLIPAYSNAGAGGTSNYGTSAPGTPGISASGNPVMTGFAPSYTMTPAAGGGYTYG
jgi:hypothetical protein